MTPPGCDFVSLPACGHQDLVWTAQEIPIPPVEWARRALTVPVPTVNASSFGFNDPFSFPELP